MSEWQLIGTGRTAEVYRSGPDRAVKLMLPGYGEDGVRHEMRNTGTASELGLPAPAVYGLVTRDGRFGYEMDYVDGRDLLREIPGDVAALGRRMAEVHVRIHQAECGTLQDLKSRVAGQIREADLLEQKERDQLLNFLDSLPSGQTVCHNDFHPGNLLETGDGIRVIDWQDASAGDRFADVAGTVLLLEDHAPPDDMPETQRVALEGLRREVSTAYQETYRVLYGWVPERVAAWRIILSASRLRLHIPSEIPILLPRVRRWLDDTHGAGAVY